MKRGLPLTLVLLAVGCGGYWGRRPLDEPRPVDPTAPLRDLPTQLRSIPRFQVDSMKVGSPTFVQYVMAGVGGVALAILVQGAFCGGLHVGCQ